MLPQFASDMVYRLKASHLSVGFTIFILGLFKKVVFADNIAIYATPVFDAAECGVILTFFEAWCGALAYTFQIYFDFSGYSDMAIGLARMFGIVLPVNFYSPYKADSIIEFWRRWHITLSRFLRDYLYIPLGGNRKGNLRRYSNLMITMLLGGLWHGAGWTFIIWGGMHGLFLSINHGWTLIIKKLCSRKLDSQAYNIAGRLATFSAIVIAWVMFRAESLDGALNMYSGMFGCNGISFQSMFANDVVSNKNQAANLLSIMLMIVWFAPNTMDLHRNNKPALNIGSLIGNKNSLIQWKPNILYAAVIAILFVISIISIPDGGEFLYFNF